MWASLLVEHLLRIAMVRGHEQNIPEPLTRRLNLSCNGDPSVCVCACVCVCVYIYMCVYVCKCVCVCV